MAKLDVDAVQDGVGRRVAELRRARGLTQELLAQRLGISFHHLQRIEYGENLTIATLVKLANVFDVAVRELFRAPKTARAKPGRPRARKTAIRRT